uniref:Collagen, type VII, alpha 1 n=1 Tax=Seriola dumerili TaxID=41447 RepID=A0A3B4UMV0_SERDU
CWNGGMIFLWGFGIVVSPADLCQLPMEEGSCGRYTLRWYFNSQAQACRPFIYSGCEGNDNRFLHLEECEEGLPEYIGEQGPPGPIGRPGTPGTPVSTRTHAHKRLFLYTYCSISLILSFVLHLRLF